MLGWIILGVIVALITLIMLIPIGADVNYEGGQLALSAKVSGLLIQLIPKAPPDESKPKKEKKPKKAKKPKKQKKPKKAPAEGEAKPKKKLSLNFNMDEILSLVKAVLRGFGVFGRKLNVDRFMLHLVAGGKDPYKTAVSFGYINAALSSLAPMCSKRFNVKDCSVWTDVDFTAEKMNVDAGIAVTIRIGAIFRMVFTIIFGALWILIKNKLRLLVEKLRKKKTAGAEGQAEQQGVNCENTVNNTENIKAEERIESNGK